MNWQGVVERTVTGLGYELVDADKSAGGLLRVFIDLLPNDADKGDADKGAAERCVNVDDCERVTRQLQHVLEVEGCAYERLEVSSPGLDRPLKTAAHFARFIGEQVEITLNVPFKGRKKYRGELHTGIAGATEGADSGWRLVLAPDAAPRTQPKAAQAAKDDSTPAQNQALDFMLDEVREARLVPVVDFKGRRFVPQGQPRAAALSNDEVDGGSIQ